MKKTELENIGHAISTVIQVRYVWLFTHMSRALFLDYYDKIGKVPFKNYAFSTEDLKKGIKPLEARYIIELVNKKNKNMAYSSNGEVYGHEYVREITMTGLRGAFLTSMQSYLEYYKILFICISNTLATEVEILDFLRQARNVFCHGNGIMNDSRLRRRQWKNIIIENNGKRLKMSDHTLHELMNDVIEKLVNLYTKNGGKLDYVSLNLGYALPAIQEYIKKIQP